MRACYFFVKRNAKIFNYFTCAGRGSILIEKIKVSWQVARKKITQIPEIKSVNFVVVCLKVDNTKIMGNVMIHFLYTHTRTHRKRKTQEIHVNFCFIKIFVVVYNHLHKP